MTVLQISMIGIAGVFVSLFMKNSKSEFAVLVTVVTGIIIFFYSISRISEAFNTISIIKNKVNISDDYYLLLVKIVGIAYICEFSSDICRDAGYSLVGDQIQMFGKITILSVSANVFINLLNVIWGLL